MLRRALFAVLAGLAFTANASAAPITLDDFTVQTTPPAVSSNGPFSAGPVAVGDPSLTAQRSIFLSVISGGFPSVASLGIGSGQAAFSSNGLKFQTEQTISYDFTTPQNLTSSSDITFNVALANTGPIPLDVFLKDSSSGTQLVGSFFINSTGSFTIPFGSVDRDQTSNLSFVVTLTNAQDLILSAGDDGGFVITGDPVPEPMTLATFGALALFGGYAARRKLKANAAAAA